MTAILKAMLARIEKIEVGEPTLALNNMKNAACLNRSLQI